MTLLGGLWDPEKGRERGPSYTSASVSKLLCCSLREVHIFAMASFAESTVHPSMRLQRISKWISEVSDTLQVKENLVRSVMCGDYR